MANFYDLLNIINEAPAAPPAPAADAAPVAAPPSGSPSTPPSLGPTGGLGGSSAPPSIPPGLSGGGMPDLSMGSPDQANSPKGGPVTPTKIKSINVWSALEKFISSKKSNQI